MIQNTRATRRRSGHPGDQRGSDVGLEDRFRCRSAQDRPDSAVDRPVCVDGQADRSGGEALHRTQRRHGGWTQGGTDREGRRRCAQSHQAHRPGPDLAGPRDRPGGLRPHAAGAGGGAGGHGSEGADDRDGGRNVGHPHALAVHRALGLRAAASHRAHGRLGSEEQDQARGHLGDRLRPRHRRREDFRQAC